MKTCPKCNSTYTDETLSFCLADGTPLVEEQDAKTEVIQSPEAKAMRIDIEQTPKRTEKIETPAPETIEESGGGRRIGMLVFGLISAFALLVTAGAAAAGIYYFYILDDRQSETVTTSKKTPDPEIEELRKKLEELQKEIGGDAKKKSGSDDSEIKGTPATVNSPNDGFLALRSKPDHKTGSRLAKIPHGARINLYGCSSKRTKIGSRTGRWCLTRYAGKTGWVFDAWVRR